MVLKPKAQLSKFYQNVYGNAFQKIELYLIKSIKKMEAR